MRNWLDLKLEGAKPICEVGALKFCIEELERENAELKAKLVEVNNNRTGVSPCARFCEALAAKKMFDNLLQQNTSLLNLLTDISQACGDNGKRMQDELVQYIAELHTKAAERDALKAQVEQLREAGNAVYDELESWSLTEQDPETLKAFDKWKCALSAAPTQCLAEVKARAVEEAISYANEKSNTYLDVDFYALEYANQLRQQAKGE